MPPLVGAVPAVDVVAPAPEDAGEVALGPADIAPELAEPGAVPLDMEPALDDPGEAVLEPADIAPEPAPDDDDAAPGLAEPDVDMADPDGLAPDALAPEPLAPAPAPDAVVDDPEPDVPMVELCPPGSIAGDPDVVDCEPEAVGRSVEGAVVVDCAKAGAASAVATKHAAICFFSMVDLQTLQDALIFAPWRTGPTSANCFRSALRHAREARYAGRFRDRAP
jgi:hypothetical protein